MPRRTEAARRTVAVLVALWLLGACGDGAGEDVGPVALPSGTTTSAAPVVTPTPAPTPPTTVPPPGSGLADVEEPEAREAAAEAGLPSDGAVQALTWTDRNGSNTVVLRATEQEFDLYLFADHVARNAGDREVLREVRDSVVDCEVDQLAEFVEEALRVDDRDADGVGEVSFAYRLNCAGDVSPSELKLLVLEDGEKHILRGSSTNFALPEAEEPPEPEPAPAQWPAGTYEAATALFDQVQRE